MVRTKIVVCADDYALSPGVSQGIRQALTSERISAISVMPLPPFWPNEAEAIRHLHGQADVGLHLTLTDQVPLSNMPLLAPGGHFPPLGDLMTLARSGNLPEQEIRAEIERQFDAFEQALDRPPDHVDGHHYVHHLPSIREWVADAVRKRAPGAYVRSCRTNPEIVLRRNLGLAKAMALNEREQDFLEMLAARSIPSNRGLAGLYDFNAPGSYAQAFPHFLAGIEQGSVLVCHPGLVDDALRQRDSLTQRREEELAWLLGSEYPQLLRQQGVAIARFREIFP